jgi:hypothetical protein
MTRRITLNPRIGNQSTFDFNYNWIVVKEGEDIKEFKAEKSSRDNYGYTAEQLKIISQVNNVLEHNLQPLMTVKEVECLLYPFGKETKIDTEDLQALAGFKVEKYVWPMK